ncbi:DUF3800 domain-containing protein [Xanthomonas arboricola]|uniref:DUF3800 domain-containing protein n=1 Tax=Xanthomonas arboricola TaxID=56448 RepID=UPI000CEDE60A|nr:DUF3800 domain-containing protein [Xanthomonas arboricola]PPT49343.1 hypothetical protein XarjCFBP7652_09035 [Xanthomonas arboricola]
MQAGVIYIDESGHTGDLLKPGRGYGFSGQPHFVLAGVGPMAPHQASELLAPLVARHRLKMQEIKSDRLHKRPAFVRDLIHALREAEVPLFIEAVDKTFFLMISIVNCQILPPVVGFAGGTDDQYVRNAFADFLYYRLPDQVLDAYVEACRADSAEAAGVSLVRLLAWAREAEAEDEEEAAILAALGQSLAEALDDFEQACAEAPDGYRRFLPVPDTGKRDKTYWLLPNYSSLTHLYARINRHQRGKLAQLTLVHDEQAQFDGILRTAKRAVETFVDRSGHVHPGADYAFGEAAELVFARSSASPGLMIADVVAGHVRRVLREQVAGREIDATGYAAFLGIWDAGDEARGIGLNLVVPTATVRQLQFDAWSRDVRGKAAGAGTATARA